MREVWSTLRLHGRALAERAAGSVRPDYQHYRPHILTPRKRWARRLLIGTGVVAFAAVASCGIVWMQLGYGPVAIDVATPWLTSAIEERLGGRHRVEVGGTVLERDEVGRSALRLRDIVVRDAHGSVIASAPKAEVGVSGVSLLTGRVQADRLSLIGAAMALRIDAGGQINLFTGGNETASAGSPTVTSSIAAIAGTSDDRSLPPVEVATDPLTALLAWIDRLDSLGLDGGTLSEIGLKNCTLVVEDQRHGKRWTFDNINLSLTRPQEGGVAFAVNSTGAGGLWSLTATVTPKPDGRRTIEAVVRDVSPKDLMLALRAGDGHFDASAPLSAVLRAEIERDGTLQLLEGRVLAGAGYFGSRDDPDSRVQIDEAQLNLRWNRATRQLQMPLEVQAGPSRVSFMAQLDVPAEAGAPWTLAIPRGLVVFASADRSRDPPLIIDRVAVRARIDPERRVFEIDQADLGGMAGGFAISGAIDYSTADPRLALGVAGTRMSVSAFKRLWPAMVTPRLRSWVVDRVTGGTVERMVIATNAPMSTFEPGGPPVPDDGLSIELVTTGNTLNIVDGLPGLARCQSQCARPGPHRHGAGRPRDRRFAVGPQARARQWPVRGAGHAPETLAGAHPLPRRGLGRRRGRAARHGAAARLLQRGARSRHHQGHVRRAGRARSRAHRRAHQGQPQLHDRRRHHEFLGRKMGARAEGGSRGAEADGEYARVLTPAAR